MTPAVFAAVLAAAVMHATWNALVKARGDRFASLSIASLGMTLAAAPVLPFVPVPGPAVWPYIAGSLTVHVGYRLFLARAYEAGDLAQTYPLARGTAPLITTLGAAALLGEFPSPVTVGGIALLSLGTILMSRRGAADVGAVNRRAASYALVTSGCIAAYTLIDGQGARLAATATSYAAWHFACDGVISMAVGFATRGRRMAASIADQWRIGLAAGVLSAASYWIAIWAMTKAPIASVAALRESSILFAMLISVLWLGERATPWRVASGLLILAGVAALRLG